MAAVDLNHLKAGLEVVMSVANAIRDAGRIPRGTLYAAFMGGGATLAQYESVERVILKSGIAKREGDELVWALD